MKSKKIIGLVLSTMLATGVLAGCSSNVKPTNGDAAKKEVVNLRIAEWGTIDSTSADKKLVDEFNSKHPDIKVTLEGVADGYGDKLMAGLAADQAPDVFLIGEGDYQMYASTGAVEPLESYLGKDKSFDVNMYQKDLLNYGKFNGKLYYLPKDFNPLALWYNKKVFDDAGVAYPNESWTWDDMLAASKKITKDTNGDGKSDVYGFFAPTWDYAVYTYLWSAGGDVSNPEGNKATGFMDSEKTINALQWYADLVLKEKVAPTPAASQSLGGDSAMFKTNKVGMMITGRWVKGDFDKAGIKYGSALIPQSKDGKRAEVICAAGWAINAKGKNKEAAYELAKWMAGKDAQKMRSDDGTVLSAINEQLDVIKAKEVNDKPVIDMMQYAQKPVGLKGVEGRYFGEFFGKALEKIFLGDASVADALKEAAKLTDEKIVKEKK